MELVNLMYKYINKFINSEELITELEEIDLDKYEEKEEIKKLIEEVKSIRDKYPNEIDSYEKNRVKTLKKIIKLLNDAYNMNGNEKNKEYIIKRKKEFEEELDMVTDGGKLYSNIVNLLTNNSVISGYCKNMNDDELLDFIAQYIDVPFPPSINQETFNDLVKSGIKRDKREALWRLAFNYGKCGMDLNEISDYFILKRDSYYLAELVGAVKEYLNIKEVVDKAMNTKDKEFIYGLRKEESKHCDFTSEEIKEIKDKYSEYFV